MNSTVLSGSDLEMPSGCEVESATFHEPVRSEALVPVVLSRRERLMGKVNDLKWRVQHRLDHAKSSARNGVQSSMQSNPMKWAAIAAGSGFALGMAGRILQWRSKRHRHGPQLVIIESTC